MPPPPPKYSYKQGLSACITGALWAKRGERAILRETPGDCESRDEAGRMFRAWRKLLRLPSLAHKAPVMQALKPCLYEYLGGGGGGGGAHRKCSY